jgi:hypothetical protein
MTTSAEHHRFEEESSTNKTRSIKYGASVFWISLAANVRARNFGNLASVAHHVLTYLPNIRFDLVTRLSNSYDQFFYGCTGESHMLKILRNRLLFAWLPAFALASCETTNGFDPKHVLANDDTSPCGRFEIIPMQKLSKLNYIIVGEVHGTDAIPEFFSDFVCDISHKRTKVVVALEFNENLQPHFDEFFSSDGGQAAKMKFRESAWSTKFPDGRTSEAMFGLMVDLWRLQRQGRILRVAAVRPSFEGNQAQLEKIFAQRVLQSKRDQSDALVILLVGNFHAMRSSPRPNSELQPMASFLPRSEGLSLNVDVSGSAWGCESNNGLDRSKAVETKCGPYPLNAQRNSKKIEIIFNDSIDNLWDGTIYLPNNSEASPPIHKLK